MMTMTRDMSTYRVIREHTRPSGRISSHAVETVTSREWAEHLAAQFRALVAAEDCPTFRADRIVVIEERN